MDEMQKMVNNARRLSYALYCATSDPVAVQRIATALHYDTNQLRRDMVDIDVITRVAVDFFDGGFSNG